MTKTNKTHSTEVEQEEQTTWYPSGQSVTYVVVRSGIRVSDKEYSDVNSEAMFQEAKFWKRVLSNYPDGTKISMIQYDKKKHRVW